ncbi:unnamed protein product [Mytilus coruscus]|uniref:B box-type domain-containing protein n=1 Tax=Mytilus coruscus TaxID=42192 RepID=A0A6J8F4V3_MYTCO|nr:unnamed protein product [Mytilus coruscus]
MTTGVKDFCDICYYQHITTKAIVFCFKCDEKLCKRCSANHSVAKLSTKHECITLDNFSKLPKFVRDTKLYCKAHDERYEYFCNEHDEPCCINCLNRVHSECRNMSNLQYIFKYVKFSRKFCDLGNMLSDLIHNISNAIEACRENRQELKKQKIQFRQDIRSASAIVHDSLHKMELKITMEMYKEFSEKGSDIENLLEKFERYLSIMSKSQEFLNTIKIFASDFQAFIAVRKISKYANYIDQAMRKVFKGRHLIPLQISMNTTSLYLIESNVHSLGNVNVKYLSRKHPFETRLIGYAVIPTKSPDIHLKANFSVTIPCFDGTRKFNISGCCILKNDNVLITNSTNHRLILLNSNGEFIKQVNLTFIPLGTVYLNTAQIIIASYNEKQLHFFDIEKDEISKTMAYDENLQIKSISLKVNDILVQNDSRGFSFLNSEGQVETKTKSILYDSDLHKVVCISEQLYYIANDGLCCCDMQGDEIWKFQHLQLRKPYALTSNGSDILITTDYQTGYVFAIGTDGQSFKIFYADERLKYVNSMNYESSKKKLLMVTEKGTVFMYDVARKND